MEVKLKSYDPFAYRINNVCDFDRSLVTAYKADDKIALNVKLALAEKHDYKVYICVNKSYHAFILCVKSLNFKEDTDIYKDLSDVSRIELCFEDKKARMYKIRWRIEPYVNIKETLRKVYFISTFTGVSTVAFQCSALGASPNGYSVLVDDCVEFTKRFCKELVKYASNGTDIKTDVESQIRSATASGFSAEQLSREIRSSAYMMNTFLGGADISTFLMTGKGKILLIFAIIMADVYNVNNVSTFNKDVVRAYRNNDQNSLDSRAAESKTDYDIFICINKNNNAFVMCVPNVDPIDDPMMYAHIEHSANPEDIPALLFVSLFELSADDNVPFQYKLTCRIAPFTNVKGQIKTSYFIGHIRSVSVIELQFAALDASPKEYKAPSVDNIEFVKHFCRKVIRYSSTGQSQEQEFESQLHLVPDAQKQRNICRRLLTAIIDKIDVTTHGGGGIILVLVVMLLYPILVNWFLL